MKRSGYALMLMVILTACITVETHSPATPLFVTSELHPSLIPSSIPTVFTITTEAPTPPRPANCADDAILIQDVTIPDGTRLAKGESFTKSWRLRNTGTCPWDETYHLVFINGERMQAPDFISVPATYSNSDVDISVSLIAPTENGTYTAYFELRNPVGKPIRVGWERSIWVNITIGELFPIPSWSDTPSSSFRCDYSLNDGYVYELFSLINEVRNAANLPLLTLDPQLTAAAQGHSQDMACYNFLGHFGSDGKYINDRITQAGYLWVGFAEIIAIGSPQDAMNQWRADPGHWEFVLIPGSWDVGIGYAYYAASDYGGYFTVDFASR